MELYMDEGSVRGEPGQGCANTFKHSGLRKVLGFQFDCNNAPSFLMESASVCVRRFQAAFTLLMPFYSWMGCWKGLCWFQQLIKRNKTWQQLNPRESRSSWEHCVISSGIDSKLHVLWKQKCQILQRRIAQKFHVCYRISSSLFPL